MRTYVIGRSPHADIVLADPSVARRHAELLSTDDGRLFLTDCASDSGSWRQTASPINAAIPDWLPLRQAFIDHDEPLRLGDFHCSGAQLLQMAGSAVDTGNGSQNGQNGQNGHPGQDSFGARNEPTTRPHGSVERDPHTGEIIRRRAQ